MKLSWWYNSVRVISHSHRILRNKVLLGAWPSNLWFSAGSFMQHKLKAANLNKKILHSKYFCDAVYDITNRINLKFCRTRKILAPTFLLWENLNRHYFFKSVSIILYDKSLWKFSFISWKYTCVGISFLIRLQVNFDKILSATFL